MVTAAANPLQACNFQFKLPFPWWWAYIALVSLILVVAITFTRSQGYPNQAHPVWSALSDMEKAKASFDSPPPASAMDVLKPLSLGGTFPSSGAVAARAREQMQMQQRQNASSPASGTPKLEAQQTSDGGRNGLQKRNETVQTVYEKDADGGRTFRRLVVEYI
ncbi:hypothetical protein N7486_001552 [Penicillium sp. IBT 16267x]|nr:hypothetical protein N7486_001552 [Penicillium sp. IBT 16267x]